MFITTPDSPVYCSQHPSRGTDPQSWTLEILGGHEKFTDRACTSAVAVLTVTEPHPSAACSRVCTCRAAGKGAPMDVISRHTFLK